MAPMAPRSIAPTHRAIKRYHEELQSLRRQRVRHELGLRAPFQNLLTALGKEHGWSLVAELCTKGAE
jgi:hypothetical protein